MRVCTLAACVQDPYPHPMEKGGTAWGSALSIGTDPGPDGSSVVFLYLFYPMEGESFQPVPRTILCTSVHSGVTEAFLEACEAGRAAFAVSRLPMVASESEHDRRERVRWDFERCHERCLLRSVPEASRELAVDEPEERPVEVQGSAKVCAVCEDPIPVGKRGDASFCSSKCRKRAWRHRQRLTSREYLGSLPA